MMWSCSWGNSVRRCRICSAVAAGPQVAPERRPPGGRPLGLLGARGQEVGDRLQAVRPQVGPVRVGPVDRVPQDQDQPGVGHRLGDPLGARGVGQVEGACSPRAGPLRGPRRRAARTPRGARPTRGQLWASPGPPRRAGARRRGRTSAPSPGTGTAGVAGQRGVQRGGAGLRRTDDEEVREGHRPSGPVRWRSAPPPARVRGRERCRRWVRAPRSFPLGNYYGIGQDTPRRPRCHPPPGVRPPGAPRVASTSWTSTSRPSSPPSRTPSAGWPRTASSRGRGRSTPTGEYPRTSSTPSGTPTCSGCASPPSWAARGRASSASPSPSRRWPSTPTRRR